MISNDPPIVWYPFDTWTPDKLGSIQNQGSYTWQANGYVENNFSPGYDIVVSKDGSYLNISGVDMNTSYLNIADSNPTVLYLYYWSFSFSFKTQSPSNGTLGEFLVFNESNNYTDPATFSLGINETGCLYYKSFDTTVLAYLCDNTWHDITVVCQNGIILYIDGVGFNTSSMNFAYRHSFSRASTLTRCLSLI